MDLSDEYKSADLPQTIGLQRLREISHVDVICILPKALNSNLTSPLNRPFSKISTRSVDRLLPFSVARNADSSLSMVSLINKLLLTAELGT